MAKVVLHEIANAFSRLVVPRCSLSKLWNVRPPMFTVGGHCTVVEGRSPFLVSAEAVTTLNVDPGGKMPGQRAVEPARPLDDGQHLAGGRLEHHHVDRLGRRRGR